MGTGLLLRAQSTRVHVELRQGSFSTFQISQSDSLNHYKNLWCYCILATKTFFFTPQPHQWTLGMIVWRAQKHTALKVCAVCVVIQELWKDQSYFYSKLNVLSVLPCHLNPSWYHCWLWEWPSITWCLQSLSSNQEKDYLRYAIHLIAGTL